MKTECDGYVMAVRSAKMCSCVSHTVDEWLTHGTRSVNTL